MHAAKALINLFSGAAALGVIQTLFKTPFGCLGGKENVYVCFAGCCANVAVFEVAKQRSVFGAKENFPESVQTASEPLSLLACLTLEIPVRFVYVLRGDTQSKRETKTHTALIKHNTWRVCKLGVKTVLVCYGKLPGFT